MNRRDLILGGLTGLATIPVLTGCLSDQRGPETPNDSENASRPTSQETTLSVLWTQTIGGERHTRDSLAATDDRVFVISAVERTEWPHPGAPPLQGKITAVDIRDGTEAWSQKLPLPLSGVEAHGSRVVASTGGVSLLRSEDGNVPEDPSTVPGNEARRQLNRENFGVFALDGATGEVTWHHGTDGTMRIVGVDDRSVLYAGTGYGDDQGSDGATLTSLDPETGDERWSNGIPMRHTVAATRDVVAIADTAGSRRVEGVARASGERRWRRDVEVESTVATPASETYRLGHVLAGDGAFYVNVDDAGVVRLDAGDGATDWQTYRRGPGPTAHAVNDRTVVTTMGGKRVSGLDRATGERRWTADHALGRWMPVSAGDTVALVTEAGTIIRLDAGSGQETGRVTVSGGPVIAPLLVTDGRIAVLHGDVQLSVLD